MARIHLIFLAVILYCITYIHAAATVNTIGGPVAQGAEVYITYTITGTPPAKVSLQVINYDTKDTKVLSEDLAVPPVSFKWVIDVVPGTYTLSINDGTGAAFSGNFVVIAGKLPPPAPGATTSAAAPAPAATTAAPAPPAASPTTAAAATTAAKAADAPKSSSAAAAAASTPGTPSPTSSAPSFSGYSLLVSLAVVAAIMFHLA